MIDIKVENCNVQQSLKGSFEELVKEMSLSIYSFASSVSNDVGMPLLSLVDVVTDTVREIHRLKGGSLASDIYENYKKFANTEDDND